MEWNGPERNGIFLVGVGRNRKEWNGVGRNGNGVGEK